MWNTRVVLFIWFYIIIRVNCKRFETRCKLVRELMRVGMPNDIFLGQWVCLIEKASNRDTSAFVAKSSGKKYYGLYQIPNQWCREKKRGGGCNITCEALLDEDIRDDTACAVKISQLEGFKYWPQWTKRCKNDNFITNEIYKCPDLIRLSPERSVSSSKYRRSYRLRKRRAISKVTSLSRSRQIN